MPSKGPLDDLESIFRRPADINAIASSTEYFGASGSDLWTSADTQNSRHTTLSSLSVSHHPNVTCATQDNSVLPFKPSLPDWMILTAPKISCWYSHVSAIHQFIGVKFKRNNFISGSFEVIFGNDGTATRDCNGVTMFHLKDVSQMLLLLKQHSSSSQTG
ncbi:uncharacterized protein F5147DRAFT_814490 [Suillus discolor]|uniref:Uncharacterized protein n=1 Tax=Suillus discolor TaxID=1912936 RepID=A0A9P7JKT8_9AGAM|nr:uncharacterized protein F5147DRAFT_814490 [Suillus discolor]KAG2080147.1 hypothetical protein F5147DRAFT_814490 [Suillus discolor]